jgi:RNA polymerase sigma-70 factor (ECF subfamily)
MNVDSLLGKDAQAAAIDFDAAVERFYEALYQFGFSLSGNASDAADLTQETYRVLLLKAEQIRDPQKVKSWLFTTLYREFLRGRQHLSRFPEVELEEAADDLPVISAANVDELDAAAVLSAVQALEEKYRAPVAMFYLDDLPYKEIAEILDIPIGTVMSRLSRGKLALRQKLSEIFADKATGPRSTTAITTTLSKPSKAVDVSTARLQRRLNPISVLVPAAI